jgi:hypothetical protein
MLQGIRLKSVDVAYMCAKANYEHNLSQVRVSRFAAWTQHVDPVRSWIDSEHPRPAASSSIAAVQPKKYMFPTHLFAPMEVVGGARRYQVLIFKHEHVWKLGVVLETFRGALAKKRKGGDSDNSTRSMRVTKPVAFPLKMQSVSKIKMVVLQAIPAADCPSNSSGDVYQASCLSPSFTMDPHNPEIGSCVYGQLPVKTVLSEWPILKILLVDGRKIFDKFQVAAEPGSRVRALSSGG